MTQTRDIPLFLMAKREEKEVEIKEPMAKFGNNPNNKTHETNKTFLASAKMFLLFTALMSSLNENNKRIRRQGN